MTLCNGCGLHYAGLERKRQLEALSLGPKPEERDAAGPGIGPSEMMMRWLEKDMFRDEAELRDLPPDDIKEREAHAAMLRLIGEFGLKRLKDEEEAAEEKHRHDKEYRDEM